MHPQKLPKVPTLRRNRYCGRICHSSTRAAAAVKEFLMTVDCVLQGFQTQKSCVSFSWRQIWSSRLHRCLLCYLAVHVNCLSSGGTTLMWLLSSTQGMKAYLCEVGRLCSAGMGPAYSIASQKVDCNSWLNISGVRINAFRVLKACKSHGVPSRLGLLSGIVLT